MKVDNLEDIYQLSPMQQGLLFHTLHAPEDGIYTVQVTCRLCGELNIAAFERTWQQVVDRHSILRTCFLWEDLEIPVQVVHRQVPIALAYQDWRGLPSAEQARRLEAYLETNQRRAFTLSEAPLMQLEVFQLADDQHQFVWSHHHLLLDGWSEFLVFQEVFQLYDAFCRGRTAQLQDARPYGDYIEWLRRQDLSRAEEFWRSTLKGFTAPTPLRVDRAIGAIAGQALNAEERLSLSAETTAALQALARQHQVTLNTLVQGAWALLLSRYSGEADIVFGATVAGRPPSLAGIESMIGLFINTLPIRLSVDPQERVLPWLKQLQGRQAEVRQFEYSPLAQVQKWSDVPRGTALFESIVIFENYPIDASLRALPGRLDIADTRFIARSNYALTLVAVPGQELILKLSYDRSRFDQGTITRMLGHVQVVLEGFMLDIEQSLGALPLVSEAERRQLLVEWNATAAPYPDDQCIHQLFEAQAARTPEAVALSYIQERSAERANLTYAELDTRANQLAHYLQQRGVGPEVLVGVCMETSLELVVALLGILKAGGVYVPLDPSYPSERLAFMLQDSRASILLTATTEDRGLKIEDSHTGANQKLSSILYPLSSTASVVDLTTDWDHIAQESAENPKSGVSPAHLAYLIYTSGTTGRPKGVQVSHGNLVATLSGSQAIYQFTLHARVPCLASFAFDISLFELFSPLLAGGTAVLVPEQLLLDLPAMVDVIADLTFLHGTPSLLRQLVNHLTTTGSTHRFGALRQIATGGDAVPPDLPGELHRVFSAAQVHIGYGPTEAAIVCTNYRVPRDQPVRTFIIGAPMQNTAMRVYDKHGQLVPIGVPGELYIGGAGVARGYLNRDELTDEKFVLLDGQRWYRTGDVVRWLENGTLDFAGRVDNQVKIRGYRIELGEIEAVLGRHPGVAECVVVARALDSGEKRLVAYIVPTTDHRPPTTDHPSSILNSPSSILHPPSSILGELRAFLMQSLPDYMVPSAFVMLDALPLTQHGKVNRPALPAPDTARPDLDQEFVAPQTDRMRLLAEIWASVLGLKQVGIYDNFFELGGDSILSVQIVARANQAGLHLTSKLIFEHPTIAALAAHTTHVAAPAAPQGLLSGPLPFTPIQHWFFAQDFAEPHYLNQALLLELRRAFDPELLAQVWELLIQHHDALRLRFQPTAQGWRQQYVAPDPTPPFTRIDLRALPEAEQAAALTAQAVAIQQSLHLSDGPLVRVALFERGAARGDRLLLVAHHLVIDTVSWRILLEDLHALYSQLAEGQPPWLPPKTTSYRQWAEQLADYAQSERCQAELPYWRAVATQARPLPRDMAARAEANTIATARTVRVSFDAEETRALLQELPRTYQVQITDVLLTALGQALQDWSGQAGVLVDLEGHGREELFAGVDISRTVGWFTTIYPLWLQVAGADLGAQVKGVKEQLRGVPERGLGYGVLRYLHPDAEVRAELAGCAQAEVGFNYLGQLDPALGVERGFGAAPEAVGPAASPANRRGHLLELTGLVFGGQLAIDWSYSAALHRPDTIAALAERFGCAVRALIAYCLAAESQGYTPSDFPAMGFSQQELDELVAELDQPL